MSGLENDVIVAKNVNFDYASNPPHPGIITSDGQLLIGSASGPALRAGNLTSLDGSIKVTNGPGTIDLSSFDPNSTIKMFDDFIGWDYNIASNTVNSNLTWINGGTANFNSVQNVLDNGHPGLITHSLLAGTYANLILPDGAIANPSIILGGGELSINFVLNINDITNTAMLLGFADAAFLNWLGIGGPVDGGFWSLRINVNNVQAQFDTPILVTTGWHNVGIIVSADASNLKVIIDGVLGLNINYPTDFGNLPINPMNPIFMIQDVGAGVAAGAVILDLMYMTQNLTVKR